MIQAWAASHSTGWEHPNVAIQVQRHSWLTDNSIMVIPLEGKSAGLLVPGLVPVVGVNLAMYFSNSILDEQFPFFVTSKDPMQSHLGIREAFYAQRWNLVLQTAVDRNNEVCEEEC